MRVRLPPRTLITSKPGQINKPGAVIEIALNAMTVPARAREPRTNIHDGTMRCRALSLWRMHGYASGQSSQFYILVFRGFKSYTVYLWESSSCAII